MVLARSCWAPRNRVPTRPFQKANGRAWKYPGSIPGTPAGIWDSNSLLRTREIRGFVRIARAFVSRDHRIRAQRPLESDAFRSAIIDKPGCDDLFRGDPLFDPTIDRAGQVMF